MNKIVLVGNGFDLAHGLPTRYTDFILWYLSNSISDLFSNGEYSDPLISFTFTMGNFRGFPQDFKSIHGFKVRMNQFQDEIKFEIIGSLFKSLYDKSIDFLWADIEREYYFQLKKLFFRFAQNSQDVSPRLVKLIKKLNNEFKYIQNKLVEYLSEVSSSEINLVPDIESHFKEYFSKKNTHDQINLFINFNYTPTLEVYLAKYKLTANKLNHIHGQLNNELNPIIFGYGDEIDKVYQQMEDTNQNEFLKNFKSFSYLLTSNYQNLSEILDRDDFIVFIMGHSCGLSDRTMLNMIFEHPKCRLIKILYHQRNEFENDYIEKLYEISRHFSPESKGKMRLIIETYNNSKPLVKLESNDK